MLPKTKVQLKAEIEQARRELRELREESEAQIQALQEAEEGLRAEMEELRGVVQESNRQLGEKTVRLEEAEAQVRELQEALEASRDRSEFLERSRSPRGLQSDEATLGKAVEVSSVVKEVEQARDEASDATDRSQWELDKMKSDM